MEETAAPWAAGFGEGLRSGMSERIDGSMRLRAHGQIDEATLVRRQRYLVGRTAVRSIAAPLCVHGADVAVVSGGERLRSGHALFPETDALVTDAPGVVLTVTAADCLPVFFFDAHRRTIGVAHAGWRGLVAPEGGVLAATARALVGLGAAPERLHAAVGPSIGPCHYPVGEEVRERFRAADLAAALRGEAVDLRLAARLLLERGGIPSESIFADPPCTVCQTKQWFSRRADGIDPPKTGMAWLMLA